MSSDFAKNDEKFSGATKGASIRKHKEKGRVNRKVPLPFLCSSEDSKLLKDYFVWSSIKISPVSLSMAIEATPPRDKGGRLPFTIQALAFSLNLTI